MALLLLTGCVMNTPDSKRDVRSHPDAEAGMVCGTVGNITMKFPTQYTFLGVTYAGVDYWKGQGHPNKMKWCDDRLLEASLSVTWPELAPAGGQSWYTSEDPRYITISVGENGSPDPNEAMVRSLENYSGDGLEPAVPRAADEIDAFKTWSDRMGLYMIDANTFSPANRRRVFWDKSKDGSISVLIVCRINTATGSSRCNQKSFDKERGVWLTMSYRAPLLSMWRDISKSSVELVDKLTIRHKDK
ncbi:hypothetical protein ACFOPN_00345 [Xanthomonas hyacinthi]|uniref:hypothetical protein n=1 Tax=Xanthomonas hyacinthi TaxID=56455 RepID=UPI00130310E9|nr:hypothetical protein [Xanthomonas hyacinthi]